MDKGRNDDWPTEETEATEFDEDVFDEALDRGTKGVNPVPKFDEDICDGALDQPHGTVTACTGSATSKLSMSYSEKRSATIG